MNSSLSQGHKGLIVWQRGLELVILVYRVTRTFPLEEKYGLVAQMRRAALSVIANIAEGHIRKQRSKKDFVSFLYIAEGSLAELECFFDVSRKLGYLSVKDYKALESVRRKTVYLLRKLIESQKQ